jgi:hypothetical protein
VRVVPGRSPWLQLLATFGGCFVGPFAALRVSMTLVPESDLVQTASVVAFALVFAGGAVIWLGLGLAAVVLSFFWNLIRGRAPGRAALGPSDRTVPPGHLAFIVLGVAAGFTVGLLAAVATQLSSVTALAAYTALGLGYGWLLWGAAHHGYLPFDPE